MIKIYTIKMVELLENYGHPIINISLTDNDNPEIKIQFFYYPEKSNFIKGLRKQYLRDYANESGMAAPKQMIIPKLADITIEFLKARKENYNVKPLSWPNGMTPSYDKISREFLNEEEFFKILNNGFPESKSSTLEVVLSIGDIWYVIARNKKEYDRLTEYYEKLGRY